MDLLTPKQHHELEGYLRRSEENRKTLGMMLIVVGAVSLVMGIGLFAVGAIIAGIAISVRESGKRRQRNAGDLQWTELEMYRNGQYRCSVVTVGASVGMRNSYGIHYLRDTQGVEYCCPFDSDYRLARTGLQMVAVQIGEARYIMRAEVLEGASTLEEMLTQQAALKAQEIPDEARLARQAALTANPVYPDAYAQDIVQGQFAQQEQYGQQPMLSAYRGERSPNRQPQAIPMPMPMPQPQAMPMPMPQPQAIPTPMPMPQPAPQPAPRWSAAEMEPLITPTDALDDSDLNMLMPDNDD